MWCYIVCESINFILFIYVIKELSVGKKIYIFINDVCFKYWLLKINYFYINIIFRKLKILIIIIIIVNKNNWFFFIYLNI